MVDDETGGKGSVSEEKDGGDDVRLMCAGDRSLESFRVISETVRCENMRQDGRSLSRVGCSQTLIAQIACIYGKFTVKISC